MSPDSYIPLRKTREFSDVLSVTFQFLRANYKKLGTCLIYFVLPCAAFTAFAYGFVQKGAFKLMADAPATGEIPDSLIDMGIGYLLLLLGLGATNVVISLVVLSFFALYLDREGDRFEVREVWERAKPGFLRFVGLSLFIGFVLTISAVVVMIPCLGIVLYLIGVVYFVPTWTMAYPAIVFEDLGIMDAISRGSVLVKERRLETIGILFLAYLVSMVLGAIFGMPAMVVAFYTTFSTILDGSPGATLQAVLFVVTAISMLGSTLMMTLPLAAMGFQYFNLVEKVDRTGLMERMKAMEEDNWSTGHRPPQGPIPATPEEDPGHLPDEPSEKDTTGEV